MLKIFKKYWNAIFITIQYNAFLSYRNIWMKPKNVKTILAVMICRSVKIGKTIMWAKEIKLKNPL